MAEYTETPPSEQKEMSFLGHLEELRWRLVRSSIAIVAFAVVVFIFIEELFEHVILAPQSADFITYRFFCKLSHWVGMGDKLCAGDVEVDLQSIEVLGQFSSHIFISIVGGIIIAFPYIFTEIWGFIKPGLRQKEKKAVRGLVAYASLLFFFGVLFGYFVIAPLTVQFFGSYQMHEDITNNFKIDSYLSIVTSTTFASGLIFQLPIVVYILSKIGMVTPEFLKKYRRHALIVVLILSAIITPPDVISQVIVSLPILVLYEVSIHISRAVNKKNQLR